MTSPTASPDALSLDNFWAWLIDHPNCILRAGTPDTVLFDDDDLHWQFGSDGPTLITQVLRGKRLMGEMLMNSEAVAYVELHTGEREDEFFFDLIVETESERVVAYFFVMAHGVDDDGGTSEGRHAVH